VGTPDIRNSTASAMLVLCTFWTVSIAEEYRLFFRSEAEGLGMGGQSPESNFAIFQGSLRRLVAAKKQLVTNTMYHIILPLLTHVDC
jgi:hypothetical protein